MINGGLTTILKHLNDSYKDEIQFSCGKLIQTLSSNPSFLPVIMDSGVDKLESFKNKEPKYQVQHAVNSSIFAMPSLMQIFTHSLRSSTFDVTILRKFHICWPEHDLILCVQS